MVLASSDAGTHVSVGRNGGIEDIDLLADVSLIEDWTIWIKIGEISCQHLIGDLTLSGKEELLSLLRRVTGDSSLRPCCRIARLADDTVADDRHASYHVLWRRGVCRVTISTRVHMLSSYSSSYQVLDPS